MVGLLLMTSMALRFRGKWGDCDLLGLDGSGVIIRGRQSRNWAFRFILSVILTVFFDRAITLRIAVSFRFAFPFTVPAAKKGLNTPVRAAVLTLSLALVIASCIQPLGGRLFRLLDGRLIWIDLAATAS